MYRFTLNDISGVGIDELQVCFGLIIYAIGKRITEENKSAFYNKRVSSLRRGMRLSEQDTRNMVQRAFPEFSFLGGINAYFSMSTGLERLVAAQFIEWYEGGTNDWFTLGCISVVELWREVRMRHIEMTQTLLEVAGEAIQEAMPLLSLEIAEFKRASSQPISTFCVYCTGFRDWVYIKKDSF